MYPGNVEFLDAVWQLKNCVPSKANIIIIDVTSHKLLDYLEFYMRVNNGKLQHLTRVMYKLSYPVKHIFLKCHSCGAHQHVENFIYEGSLREVQCSICGLEKKIIGENLKLTSTKRGI